MPERSVPELVDSHDEAHEVVTGGQISFTCDEKGALPVPVAKWFVVRPSSNPEVKSSITQLNEYSPASRQEAPRTVEIRQEDLPENKKMYVIHSNATHSELFLQRANETATYRCRFENWKGFAERNFNVIVKGMPPGILLAIVVTVFVILALCFLVFRAFRRQKASETE